MALSFLRRKQRPPRARLGGRRKKVLTVKSFVTFVSLFAFVGIVIWALQLDQITVSHIHIEGNSTIARDVIEDVVLEQISGTYAYLIPRSNSFLFPDKSVIKKVKESFFRIDDVAITKNNLATITVTVSEREPFALWCGEEYSESEEVLGTCYFLDESGYVFAKSPDFSGNVFFKYSGRYRSKRSDPLRYLQKGHK